ncbi:MAG TPA: ABC transporter permease, partial [Puia sp.]|nr:ABC transporter permease [Puia sp.]
MFRNYLKTGLRSLWRNKIISSINVVGLALGISCSLLIMLWIQDEKSIDGFHHNGAQLYTIMERQYRDGKTDAFFGGPGMLADEMKRVLPDVQFASNFAWNELKTFEANNKIIKENGNHAGSDFFKMFTYPLLQGNADNSLQSIADIAISKKMAEEFFGSADSAMGKTIRYQNNKDLKITAVFDNLPENSTAQFDYLLSWQSFLQDNAWAKDWSNNGPQTYLMLRNGTDPEVFEKKINRFLDNYNMEQTPRSYSRLGIERYGDVYLHSNF